MKVDKKFEDALVKIIRKVLIEWCKFNITQRATIVSVDSTYRCTVTLLDDTTNRTGVIIPAQISGTLSGGDDVKILIENGNYTNMTVLYKIQ